MRVCLSPEIAHDVNQQVFRRDQQSAMRDPTLPIVNTPGLDLLGQLPAELVAGLFATARTIVLKADQQLFGADDAGDACYRVEEGLLKISILSPSGGERILAIFGPGAIVGELSLIDGSPRSATVTALRASKLSSISRSAFQSYAEDYPEIYQRLTMILARRLRDTNAALTATSFLSVKGRVAGAILNLAEAFGHDVGGGRTLVRQKVTQSDLAAMAGIARENVSRVLQEWIGKKIVSRISGYYCIENRAALKREAGR
jgi:CRP/FNR family transcriptional regulator, cyclic AMP receptor protein